jgi:hypothetical protein
MTGIGIRAYNDRNILEQLWLVLYTHDPTVLFTCMAFQLSCLVILFSANN